jgi:hypothetical protein
LLETPSRKIQGQTRFAAVDGIDCSVRRLSSLASAIEQVSACLCALKLKEPAMGNIIPSLNHFLTSFIMTQAKVGLNFNPHTHIFALALFFFVSLNYLNISHITQNTRKQTQQARASL